MDVRSVFAYRLPRSPSRQRVNALLWACPRQSSNRVLGLPRTDRDGQSTPAVLLGHPGPTLCRGCRVPHVQTPRRVRDLPLHTRVSPVFDKPSTIDEPTPNSQPTSSPTPTRPSPSLLLLYIVVDLYQHSLPLRGEGRGAVFIFVSKEIPHGRPPPSVRLPDPAIRAPGRVHITATNGVRSCLFHHS